MSGEAQAESGSVRLFSDGLLSKWGFGDGDAPDHWLDYRDDHGLPWQHWHPVLCELVHRFLLPALDQRVEMTQISTAHNPIRATMVDGVNIEDHWYDSDYSGVCLTPEFVDVPFAEVLKVAESVSAQTTREE